MQNFTNKLLKDFIVVSNQIPNNVCNKLIQDLSTKDWGYHKWNTRQGEEFGDDTKEFRTHFSEQETIDILIPYVKNAIQNYFHNLGNDAVFGIGKISQPRINRYDENTQMLSHVDHIHTVFEDDNSGIPILSIVGCLNDDYEAGEFVFGDDYAVSIKAGDILVFPSIFLYPHRVNSITKGSRYSFVCWAY